MVSRAQLAGAAALAALVGVAAVAWGQEAAEPVQAAATGDPVTDLVLRLVSGGGLPAVLALVAWWARGQLGAGVPVVLQLHPEDRAELRRIRRALERADDSDEPPPPRAA